jgi:hypothetical protein
LTPTRLVIIDETWASTALARLRGRALKGERRRAGIPQATTFVAGLRLTGMVAPMVLDGPINSDTFLAYVSQYSHPNSPPATSSSWTISAATRPA